MKICQILEPKLGLWCEQQNDSNLQISIFHQLKEENIYFVYVAINKCIHDCGQVEKNMPNTEQYKSGPDQ